MVYIKTVKLENFQSHKDTSVNFVNGLNVITGPSDSGKSAIIRAIKWVLYNEPRGTDFITTNETQCRVSLTLHNDVTIIRERTSSKNRYTLIKDKEKQTYEGFGNTVPQEITNSHQIRNIYLDTDQKTSINLSNQLDGPFLLSQSGAIRAKSIGRVLGIHYLDAGARKVSSSISELRKEYTGKLEEQVDLQDQLATYDIYVDQKKQVDKAKEAVNSLKLKSKTLEAMKGYAYKLKTLNEDILDGEKVLNRTQHLDTIESSISSLTELNSQHKSSLLFQKKLIFSNKEIGQCNDLLLNTANIQLLQSKLIRSESILNSLSNYKNLLTKHIRIKKEINHSDKVISNTSNLSSLENKLNSCHTLINRITQLNIVRAKLIESKKETHNCVKIISATSNNINLQENIDQIEALELVVNKAHINLISLVDNTQRIAKGKGYIKAQEDDFNMCLEKYQKNLLQLKECPVCEAVLDHSKARKLVTKWKEV